MELDKREYDYNKLKQEGTGGPDMPSDFKTIVYPFNKYQITIRLTQDNRFIEVIEVKINKEFLSHKQKISTSGSIDVRKDYPE